jgi:release factor glutamine methyltransferase
VNVRGLLADAIVRLGGGDARLDAELLLAHVLGKSRAWLFAWPEYELDAARHTAFERMIAARERGEPVAYLTGHREFWSLDLAVTPDVLIPRHETELLVEFALANIPADRDVRIADLGTGSGAIALALARERPRAHVLATDASNAALHVARDNAQRLDVRNVTFAEGDWCDALGRERFELIASNPPYIAERDAHLDVGDLRHEPKSALISGADGLDAIRRIVADSFEHLHPRARLVIEHGWDQAERVRALFAAAGYADVGSARDGAAHERVTFGAKPG